MDKRTDDVKGRILGAAVELLREKRDADSVSIRGIAERAGVSVGMANYHFQTKDKLIELAVQEHVAGVIRGSRSEEELTVTPASGAQEMRQRLKAAASFVAEHPGISRVSILRDMKEGHTEDNTSEVAKGVYRQLADVYGDRRDAASLRLLAAIQVAAVQHLFLRAEVNRKSTGLDFFREEDRNRMMDLIIDTVLGNEGGTA